MKRIIISSIKKIATSKILFNRLYQSNRVIPVIMYHGVSEYDSITPEILEQHFKWIADNFTSYFASEIRDIKSNLNKKPIVLTFDDGLKNNKIYVEPLLKKYKLKATFYIVSGLLTGNDFLWNHEFLIRLESLSLEERKKNFATASHKVKQFVEDLKKSQQKEVLMLLDKLRKITANLKFTPQQICKYQLMSAEDIIDLDKNIIEIGAHTDSHPILNQLSIEEAKNEILTSKYKLEKLIGRTVNTFCYPNGDYRNELVETVRNNFYSATTTESDLMDFSLYSPAEVPRLFALPNLSDFKFNLIKPMRD